MAINKVSPEAREAIARKSARSLPTRPSAVGMKPDEIKRAFYEPIIGAAESALGEIDRVVDEANAALAGERNALVKHEDKKNNPHGVTAEQVGLGNVDNTADADKPVSTKQKEALDGKLDKVTQTGKNLAYGVSTEGEQRTFPVTAESWTYSIPMRNNQRTFDIGEPKAGTHPVNRAYLERFLEAFVAKQGDQVIEGDLTVSGDLYVTGSTYGTDVESLNVKDAVIVANADGVPLAELSGYVIRVSDTQAYGILYDPAEDCVKIGLGTYEGGAFTYDAEQAQPIATRGAFQNGHVPIWNAETHRFEDSGVVLGEINAALDTILAIQEELMGGGNA